MHQIGPFDEAHDFGVQALAGGFGFFDHVADGIKGFHDVCRLITHKRIGDGAADDDQEAFDAHERQIIVGAVHNRADNEAKAENDADDGGQRH